MAMDTRSPRSESRKITYTLLSLSVKIFDRDMERRLVPAPLSENGLLHCLIEYNYPLIGAKLNTEIPERCLGRTDLQLRWALCLSVRIVYRYSSNSLVKVFVFPVLGSGDCSL